MRKAHIWAVGAITVLYLSLLTLRTAVTTKLREDRGFSTEAALIIGALVAAAILAGGIFYARAQSAANQIPSGGVPGGG